MARVSRRLAAGIGGAEIGASLAFVAINTWLLYYLINVARVPPLLAGAVFVAGRVVDAVTDPLMGTLVDRTRRRWPRLRWVRWGALPLGVAFALLWWAPAAAGEAATWVAMAALLLTSLLYTVVQVPVLSLTPDLAPDYDGRTSLTAVRTAFAVLASMLAVALPPTIVLAFSRGSTLAESAPLGWAVMGAAFGSVIVAGYWLLPRFVREPPAAREARGGGDAAWWTVLRAPGFVPVLLTFLVVTVGIMLVNSLLPFALESVLMVSAAHQTPLLALLFGTAVVSFPVWAWLTGRLGKRGALTLAALVLGGALLGMMRGGVGAGASTGTLAWTVLAGLGLAGVMALPWAMLPDVVEFDALRSGEHREGLLYAVFTFGQKLAGSVGVFANALAAALLGYVPGTAVQADRTVAGLQTLLGPVAAAVFALAALVVWTSPITRARHEQARAALAERDAAATPPAASAPTPSRPVTPAPQPPR
jgi:glycoside/pentoside/hexuronide:cation symporter, GPH family